MACECAAVTEAAAQRGAAPIRQQQAACTAGPAACACSRPAGLLDWADVPALPACPEPGSNFPICSLPLCGGAQLPAGAIVHASWQAGCAQPNKQPGSFSHISAGGAQHAARHLHEAAPESQQHVQDSVHAVPATLLGPGRAHAAGTALLTATSARTELQPDQTNAWLERTQPSI